MNHNKSHEIIGKCLECIPGNILTPSYFYIILGHEAWKLDKYSEDIHEFHQSRFIYNPVILTGHHLYSCKIQNKWRRILLLEVNMGECTIVPIDLGGVIVAEAEELKELPLHLHTPPSLAIRAHLVGLLPTLNNIWSLASANFITDLLCCASYRAYFYYFQLDTHSYGINIINRTGTVNIRQALINENLARSGYRTIELLKYPHRYEDETDTDSDLESDDSGVSIDN
ncbi:hypothetical protein PV326_012326 [Microctonus aethiopoides]|uniref:Tudor domain-containing protein n=1 Tax=Microctonus aethiopoides TaxID=144406 RepID=A0AA39C381_9HYME|nr:hypothetical protein PV326_012326 [Microctonus aethiopoides]KAK0157106.1 hypothetical protein PV328_011883 [Microctonus aethiopoides]